MNQKFDIARAPQIPQQTPLRAERFPGQAQAPQDGGHIRGVEATPGGLIRSTLIAGGAALGVLTVFYLPAEYGIDPTGLGSVMGLTEMGQIKQQLYAEAEAEAAGTPVLTVSDPMIYERFDRLEAQVAAIADVIGAPVEVTPAAAPAAPAAPAPAPAPEPAVEPVPEEAVVEPVAEPQPAPEEVAPQPEVEAAVAEAATASDWRDEVSYTLAPGEGIELKLVMEEGQTARFEWTANGAVVNYDTHGDGGGQKISYEQGRGVGEQTGELTAAFTGNHGWFWRNRTDAPVTVTLRTAGAYSEIKAP